MAAPINNQYALKFDTSEKRKELCNKYCEYVRQGFGKEYFPDCDYDTFKIYCEKYPEDFPTDIVTTAEREGKHAVQKVLFAGMLGKIPGFREKTAIFVAKNMLGWSDRQNMTVEARNIDPVVLYLPESLRHKGS